MRINLYKQLLSLIISKYLRRSKYLSRALKSPACRLRALKSPAQREIAISATSTHMYGNRAWGLGSTSDGNVANKFWKYAECESSPFDVELNIFSCNYYHYMRYT